jgi:hypothetical protein
MCVQVRLEHFCVGSAGPLNVGPGGGGPPGGSALATAAIAGVSASSYWRVVLGGGDGGDREGEGHGLPAGLLRRLCRGLFFWRLRRAVRGIEVWCSSRAFHPNILALFQRIRTELNFDQ